MQFFNQLGAVIEQRWRDRNYDEAAFPEVAAAALDEMPPHAHLNAWDIIHWVHTGTHLPRQTDVEGRFGNPPITLFAGPRFHIDVYFWLDGTTSIHQHAFSGAFQLLLGSSLHSRYEFERGERINERLAAGRVLFQDVELLGVGDTRKILSGDRFIHSLFHLDRPSATITVRTYQDVQTLPQWDYLKPYLARDPFYREETAIKKLQSASLLLAMKHPEADRFIGDLVETSDFQTAFAVLHETFAQLTRNAVQQVFQLSTGEERFNALLERARRRHGRLVDLLPPVFNEVSRQTHIISRRGYITDDEHRFFLALLLNVPDRQRFLDIVRRRFPEVDPLEKIGDWLDELATTKVLGSQEPNVLGVADFDEDYTFVFQKLLAGCSTEEVRAAIGSEYPEGYAEELSGKTDLMCERLRSAPLFKAVFSN